MKESVEGREKRERIGDGHGSLCAGHRTFRLSLRFQALRMGVVRMTILPLPHKYLHLGLGCFGVSASS